MQQTLVAAGITSCVVTSVHEAVLETRLGAAALVIGEEAIRRDGFDPLTQMLHIQPNWSDLPTLVITEVGSDWVANLEEFERPVSLMVIGRPLSIHSLLSLLANMIRNRVRQYELRDQLEQLEEARAVLEERNRLKDELFGLVSHELRTPLTTVLGLADLLSRRWHTLDEADLAEALRTIRADAERLEQLIGNMLVLSRASAETSTTLEPLLLQRALPALLASATQSDLRLEISVPQELPPILANEALLEQVFSNIVHNSHKYASPGQPLEVQVSQVSDEVVIEFRDRGQQLTEAEVAHMVEPFYRSPRALREKPGMGLGMTVCRRLLEVQGGHMALRAREGGGLSVSLTLRIASEVHDRLPPTMATAN